MPIVLTPAVADAPTITFDDMVGDISVFLPGCPEPTIARTARKIIIDLCQRAKVWERDFAPISVPAGQVTSLLTPPVLYATCTDITSAYFVVDGERIPLTWMPYNEVIRAYPKWPDDTPSTPRFITLESIGRVNLAPLPDTSGVLYVRGNLRPTPTATVWDQSLYYEFQRAIFHGVLFELMSMNNRSWTDAKGATVNGRQWTQLLAAARDRAQRGFNSDDLAVQMQPFA